jgi:hypothetical protein
MFAWILFDWATVWSLPPVKSQSDFRVHLVCFLSSRDHKHVLLVVQCSKIVASNILSRFLVTHSGRAKEKHPSSPEVEVTVH